MLALVSLAGVVLAALLGRLVGRSAMRPGPAADARHALRRDQDLSRRVDAVGDDELAGLARSFNAMLEALAESRRAQRQLVADASHELRTPLTTVQANVELLSRAGELTPTSASSCARTCSPAARADRARRRPRRARPRAGRRRATSRSSTSPLWCGELRRTHRGHGRRSSAARPCVVRRPRAARARRHQPARQRAQVEPRRRHGRRRRSADGELVVRDEGPGHRRRRPPVRVRPLLPLGRVAPAARLGPRPGDRAPGGRDARRRGWAAPRATAQAPSCTSRPAPGAPATSAMSTPSPTAS